MARVNLFEGGAVSPGGTTGARLQAPDFGPGAVGAGLIAAGRGLANYAETQQEVADVQDRASVKEAANAVAQHYADLGYTGADPYFEKAGKEALTLRPQIEKSLDEHMTQSRAGLGNERQRKLFDEALTSQRTAWGVQIAQHSAKEGRQYEIDETSSSIGLSGELGRAVYVADPEDGERQLTNGLAEIEHLGNLNGWGGERIAEEKLKFTSGLYRDVGTRIAYTDLQAGPDLAAAFVDKHGESMNADDREAVLGHARVQKGAWEAEQHRQETETRRIAREAKTDAKDSAQSVYRNIQDGVAVAPKDLADAIANASVAGDEALAEGLRQGALKNNLAQQWAGVPPNELQDRVNELSAEITRSGGNVKPDVMVERDHLQVLVAKSRAALKADPLAWGAEHLGITIQPLNLNDQNSINARIQTAATIAKRTGTTPRPLTQDEVSASQQTIQHGTVQDKVGLALRVARLGSLALPAAEQLTNNTGFHNLIGLATHSNRGVAASRVNQIVTGYDVLKTKPKLIDKGQAQREFNELVGTSLQFLPQVRDGVFSNAQALLASQANEHGWSEWGEKDQRAWFRSVNSALGAYSRDGKQVGGLARFNEGITVLPEDMSLDEFEGTVSKALGPQFRNAQNGTPVYGNGTNPTATDLKKMQWVPSGDGIYRLSNGSEFLKLKDGRYYEVDVARLR